jgi:nitric oxide reductase subunit B
VAARTRADILHGQRVWQSIGGQEVGSIWGHGAYQAPDWSADWLHREAVALLDVYAAGEGVSSFGELGPEGRGAMKERLRLEMRTNTYDSGAGILTVSEARASAMERTAEHYRSLFSDDPALNPLRESYALHVDAVTDAADREDLTHFFFWTAWACAAQRPGQAVTYSNNWPHEPLVGNAPTTANLLWSIVSVVLLGALTAHYTVEGDSFFGIPVAQWIPYAVSRTWHVQLAVFWIATAFLAVGLFLAPAVGEEEPRFQKLGVNVLFGALVVVVLGSLVGEWLSVKGHLGLGAAFWFGHQGYEYVDLGRAWQIALFGGLLLWLVLMLRGLWPAFRERGYGRHIVLLFAGSSAAIGLFYGFGLFYGATTHLSVMEYWRWWVVHLWVEGFMEVFATVAMAFIFTRLGLVRAASATAAVLFATSIFLVGGIPGTFHQLYFSGTPVSVMAIGATFSALEVVPLALIGFEAWKWNRASGSPAAPSSSSSRSWRPCVGCGWWEMWSSWPASEYWPGS